MEGALEIRRQRLNGLSQQVLGLCFEVHRHLGPGLLESAYEEALAHELQTSGLAFERQFAAPLVYKDVVLDCGYRLDFLVENELVLEIKAVAELLPVHTAQLLTYLKLLSLPLGLLLNFNVPLMKDGVRRVVCGDLFRQAER